MDFTLRCNSLKCRVHLNEKAVVTTCSHIFCVPCSESLGLASSSGNQRNCPACRAPLANPDDVVASSLNPTEDYKTSVLSGLSPAIIAECAARGLAFWHYQASQEVVFQEYLFKTLSEKYSALNLEMDKLVNNANAEIDGLNERMSLLSVDTEKLKQDNQALLNALRDKNRQHAQLREQYDRLRRNQMTQVTQNAAQDSIEESINAGPSMSGALGVRPDQLNDISRPRPTRYRNRNTENDANHNSRHRTTGFHIRSDSGGLYPAGSLQRSFSPNLTHAMPANGHRTRLGPGLSNGPNNFGHNGQFPSTVLHRSAHTTNNVNNVNNVSFTPSGRRPLAPISGNAYGGYGLSAHMRSGSIQGQDAGNEDGDVPGWVAFDQVR